MQEYLQICLLFNEAAEEFESLILLDVKQRTACDPPGFAIGLSGGKNHVAEKGL